MNYLRIRFKIYYWICVAMLFLHIGIQTYRNIFVSPTDTGFTRNYVVISCASFWFFFVAVIAPTAYKFEKKNDSRRYSNFLFYSGKEVFYGFPKIILIVAVILYLLTQLPFFYLIYISGNAMNSRMTVFCAAVFFFFVIVYLSMSKLYLVIKKSEQNSM